MKFIPSDELATNLANSDHSIRGKVSVPKVKKFNLKPALLLLVFLFAVIIPRWYYVEHFAVALPFWDQWDSEGDLLRSWLEGTLKFSDLWLPHNEHRIFSTRLFALFSFGLTGVWNNLVGARLNVLLASSIPFILVWLLHKAGELKGKKWLMLPVILAGSVLPFIWENLLVGFQSQFYFLLLFAVSALALATWRPESLVSFLAVIMLSILSVLTMASGIMTPLAVVSVYCLHWYLYRKQPVQTALFISLLLLVSIAGYLTMPSQPAHEIFRAQNIQDLWDTFLMMESWPLRIKYWAAPLLWLPTCITLPILIFRKNMTRYDLLMAGCLFWSLLQVLATSYGRGHDLENVTSRYSDFISFGLIAYAWFALRVTELFPKNFRIQLLTILISISFFVVLYKGHCSRKKDDFTDMQNRHKMVLIQIKNVSDYLKTGDSTSLQKPAFQIPYPDPVRLKKLLDDPALRSALSGFYKITVPTEAKK
ncbi:MAG: putative transrane protein [Mucilaginibacter sp.]|nr:putative transrane protein [Mucilaginibacter sp.]